MPSFVRPMITAAAATLVSLAPMAAEAQQRPTPDTREWGIDAGATFGLGDVSTTVIGIPAQRLRVGFFRTPTVSIEPTFGLSYAKAGDGPGFTQYNLGVGLLWHFQPDATQQQLYARPFVDVIGASGGGNSDTSFGLGAGLGIKLPFRPQLSTRLEANVGYRFDPGEASIGLLAGLSFFR